MFERICFSKIFNNMKSDTALLNEIAHNTGLLRNLSEEESTSLKKILLGIHNDIIKICDRYGLKVMVSGGTCLGSIRHKGYIPWDDDLDFIMPRNDYEKLLSIYENGDIDSKYLFEYPNNYKDVKNTFLKIFLKGTKLKEVFDDSDFFPSCIFVDVFPIDYAPKNKLLRRVRAFISDSLQFICTSVLYYKYPSNNLKLLYEQDQKVYRRYKVRLLIGQVFSVIPHKKWVYWFDSFNRKSQLSTVMTVPSGRRHYYSEALPDKVFLPPIESTFEGCKTYLPHEPHTYLANLYGNYMRIPPVEKRERHFVVDFKID